jgi:hypothetical protein
MNRDILSGLVIAAAALLTGLLFASEADGWGRAVVAIAFLLIAPGLACVRLLRFGDPLTEMTLAVAASLAIETVVATALLATRLWSPGTALAIMVFVTLAGAGLQILTSMGARHA